MWLYLCDKNIRFSFTFSSWIKQKIRNNNTFKALNICYKTNFNYNTVCKCSKTFLLSYCSVDIIDWHQCCSCSWFCTCLCQLGMEEFAKHLRAWRTFVHTGRNSVICYFHTHMMLWRKLPISVIMGIERLCRFYTKHYTKQCAYL